MLKRPLSTVCKLGISLLFIGDGVSYSARYTAARRLWFDVTTASLSSYACWWSGAVAESKKTGSCWQDWVVGAEARGRGYTNIGLPCLSCWSPSFACCLSQGVIGTAKSVSFCYFSAVTVFSEVMEPRLRIEYLVADYVANLRLDTAAWAWLLVLFNAFSWVGVVEDFIFLSITGVIAWLLAVPGATSVADLPIKFVELRPNATTILPDYCFDWCYRAEVAGVFPVAVRLLGTRWTTGVGLTALLPVCFEAGKWDWSAFEFSYSILKATDNIRVN